MSGLLEARGHSPARSRMARLFRSTLLLALVGIRVAAAAPPEAPLADAAKRADWAAVRSAAASGRRRRRPPGGRLHGAALGELPGRSAGSRPC